MRLDICCKQSFRLLITLFGSLAALNSTASPISLDIVLDLNADGVIRNVGAEQQWQATAEIGPVSLSRGDELIFSIRFVDSKRMSLSDLNGSDEGIRLRLLSANSQVVSWDLVGVFEYLDVLGDLAQNPAPTDTSGLGDQITAISLASLTESEFSYSGVTVRYLLKDYVSTASDVMFNKIEFSNSAGRLGILPAAVAISEPDSTLLFLLAIGTLHIMLGSRPNQALQLTHYSALFRCADIFTPPKRAVMGS